MRHVPSPPLQLVSLAESLHCFHCGPCTVVLRPMNKARVGPGHVHFTFTHPCFLTISLKEAVESEEEEEESSELEEEEEEEEKEPVVLGRKRERQRARVEIEYETEIEPPPKIKAV